LGEKVKGDKEGRGILKRRRGDRGGLGHQIELIYWDINIYSTSRPK
jgi:hypothetical protein